MIVDGNKEDDDSINNSGCRCGRQHQGIQRQWTLVTARRVRAISRSDDGSDSDTAAIAAAEDDDKEDGYKGVGDNHK